MSGYTPEEIQAVVEKLVISTIRRPYDTLGVRRADVSFGDVQEAAAGVFLLYPNSPFYVLSLGVQRLGDLIEAEAAVVEELGDALEATGRSVLPVDDVSTLFNAQAALQELSGAAVRRGGLFGDITKAPAFVRFSDNVGRFLGGPGQNVKQAGQVVQTPQQARAAIPGLITRLREAHETLLARVTGIVGGLDDYNKVNLPTVVSTSVLSNAAKLVGENADKLNALTPSDRLALIRQTVLDVLSVRAVVTTFGSFSPPSDFYSLSGLGTPYADAAHPSTPAFVLVGAGGSLGVVPDVNDTMTLTLDGGAPFDVVLQPSVMAELDGFITDERFVIGNGVLPAASGVTPNNNIFKVQVGSTTYQVVLSNSLAALPAVAFAAGDTTTAGWYGGGGTLDGTTLSLSVDGLFAYEVTLVAPANISALLAQINAVTNTVGGQHRVTANNSVSTLSLTTSATGASALIVVGSGTANAVLGLTAGQTAVGSSSPRSADLVAAEIDAALPPEVTAEGYYFPLRYSGALDIPAGVNQTWSVPGGASDLVALGVKVGDTVRVMEGANAAFWPILAVTTTTIQVQGTSVLQAGADCEVGPKNRAIRILCIDPVTQLPIEETLTVIGDTDVSANAARTLGFAVGATAQCLRTTMEGLAQDLASKTTALSFSTEDVFSLVNMRAKTSPTDPSQVSLAPTEGVGTQSFSGTTLTFTVTSVVAALDEVVAGDALVLRDGPNALQDYTVTLINGQAAVDVLKVGDVIEATGSLTGSSGTGVTAEFGPSISTPAKYQALFIESGPNTGRYTVAGPGATPLDILLLNSALPVFQVGPLPLEMAVSYGITRLRFDSKMKTLQSSIAVAGAFTVSTTVGTTPWFRLPKVPRGLQAGDILEVHAADYKLPSGEHVIASIESSLKVIGVTPEMASNVSWQFSTQPAPFARLRVGVVNSYSLMRTLLNTWLSRDVNQESFFTNFNRLVNPLLANANPTATQVGTAINELDRFYAYLLKAQAAVFGVPAEQALDAILATYTIQQVDAVDTLLRSFAEKGSDRATDLLLQGAFSTFFNLTVDGASYSGAFQEAAREVTRNDLPIRRFNRAETQTSRMISQTASPDYEFHANSVSEALVPDIPTPYGEPANYGRK